MGKFKGRMKNKTSTGFPPTKLPKAFFDSQKNREDGVFFFGRKFREGCEKTAAAKKKKSNICCSSDAEEMFNH